MENIHENQVGEVLPYQYEPEVGEKTSDVTDQSDSEQESDSSSSDEVMLTGHGNDGHLHGVCVPYLPTVWGWPFI